jgi:predicted RNase H-like HicB family nuclease
MLEGLWMQTVTASEITFRMRHVDCYMLEGHTYSHRNRQPASNMKNDFTAVYEAAEEGGYIAYAAELPGAISQGETLDEARRNLAEAIQLILETNAEQNRLELKDGRIIRETISVTR